MNSVMTGEAKTAPEAKPKRPRTRMSAGPKVEGGSADARRVAAAILEVLAGARSPSEAAEAVGVSLARYYAVENRALEGLVEACESRGKGRAPSPEKELGTLRREVEKLKVEGARRQALLRAAQRAVGLSLAEPKDPKKGKRRRRPVVRALKAVAVLRSGPSPSEASKEGLKQEMVV
jgi:hypothetical protein